MKQESTLPVPLHRQFRHTQVFLRIPADNIIVSPWIKILEFKILKNYKLDTDHFPLVAKLQF